MAIVFPPNPVNEEEFTAPGANKTWKWFDSVNAWTLVSPTLNDLAPPLLIDNIFPAEVPLITRAAALQTANLHEWQDSAASVLAYIEADGKFVFPGGLVTGRISNIPTSDTGGAVDLSERNNHSRTPVGDITITLTGGMDGQSGFIYVDNTGDHVIDFAANIFFVDGIPPAIPAGLHLLGYYQAGVNTIITSATELAQV